MRIQLWRARGIPAFLVVQIDEETGAYLTDEQHTLLVQTDWDYPSLAANFGWHMSDVQPNPRPQHWKTGQVFRCRHESTDGTVKCDVCGLEPSDFIEAAREWMDAHLSQIADDPGYFS